MSAGVITQATELTQVPACVLHVLDRTQVDLFLQHDPSEPSVLYREAGYPLSEDRANGLAQKFEGTLLVRARDYAVFCQDLSKSLEGMLKEESLPPTQRFEVLQVAVAVEIEHSLRMINCDKYVSNAGVVGRQISSLLDRGDVLPADLFDIVRHDFHTFVHVTNVASYATLLAKELGISDQRELEKIAVGGLLHDIGKRHVPGTILTNSEPLTQKEWVIIKQHPLRGYEELCQRDDLDEGQLMMVYQHHEHMDGRGYPVGVTGEEIHPWAKLLAVVDIFDALTGDRPYRTRATKKQALEILDKGAGSHLDKEMVACWASAMQKR